MGRIYSFERPWCWERLKPGGEGDDREWDGWMASPTQWTWVWVNSRSWCWTGRPDVLQSIGSQRVRHSWNDLAHTHRPHLPPSLDAHVLISGTCKLVTLQGKMDFTDMIKVRILRWRDYPGLSGWVHMLTNVLINERGQQKSQNKKWWNKQSWSDLTAGKGCHQRNVGGL